MSSRSIEALYQTILIGSTSSGPKKPGYIVSKLNEETREALKKLTSDEARKMRLS